MTELETRFGLDDLAPLRAANWRRRCGNLIATSEPGILRQIQVGEQSADGSQSDSGSRQLRLELTLQNLRHMQTPARDR
jgi:hypothetical protein